MLETLITSKTRIKLLLKFFLNAQASAYLRNLETEFGESTNAIRLELNRFEEANLLTSEMQGNKKVFRANTKHPLFYAIHNLVLKHLGFDQMIERITSKLGEIKAVFLAGDFARGIDNKIVELIFVGEKINKTYLLELVEKAEKHIKRKIRYIVYKQEEFERHASDAGNVTLLLWVEED